MVALGGGVCGCSGGTCVVALGGVCGCSGVGGIMVAPGGAACMVALGACMVALGGMCGCSGGHAWLLRWGMHGIRRDTEIRSMSGRYASYWNAFLFNLKSFRNCASQIQLQLYR